MELESYCASAAFEDIVVGSEVGRGKKKGPSELLH